MQITGKFEILQNDELSHESTQLQYMSFFD